ncbi:MAG: hypothetical protein MO852_13285 [Candidatus Devosia euplotis]|nr:hypothetical protein [Candidatus Devosia euplotis]
MIAWLKNLLSAKTAPMQTSTMRDTSPENCALWRDVARALDAKPKGTSK